MTIYISHRMMLFLIGTMMWIAGWSIGAHFGYRRGLEQGKKDAREAMLWRNS